MDQLQGGASGLRQRVLLETLAAIEAASETGRYHRLAQQNVWRWRSEAVGQASSLPCKVLVRAGDWGEVALALTREYGVTFAVLNMANAIGPGGGYAHGMVAQEENMFRRTDCHFSLNRDDIDATTQEYVPRMTALLEARDGHVYLDISHPRVCVRGPEDRAREDLGYAWLAESDVFQFYELRAAAVDLRGGGEAFCEAETARRVRAQLNTLAAAGVRHAVLSAFGCGAFMNPAQRVAAAYAAELHRRAADFDVVAFAIFNAGYGPDNFTPFSAALDAFHAGKGVPEHGIQDRDASGCSCLSSPPRCQRAPGPLPPLVSKEPPPRPQKLVATRRSHFG